MFEVRTSIVYLFSCSTAHSLPDVELLYTMETARIFLQKKYITLIDRHISWNLDIIVF